jgi:Domain of unknown function (DUF4249)
VSRFAFSVALCALAGIAGCELETVSVPPTTPKVVVHAVLNPSASEQVVYLERTLTGSTNVGSGTFDPNNPIQSAGGIPIDGALVEIIDSSGAVSTGIEGVVPPSPVTGAGVYHVPLLGPTLRLGQRYKLHVHTPQGEDLTAYTRIPLPEITSTAGLTQTINRDHDTLNIAWSASLETRAYAMRVESPFGPFFLFTDSLHVRLTGDLRNVFANALQHVLIPGFHQDILVAAVDSNFFDYYRTNDDPFTGAGIISRITGGLGLFGSLVTLNNGTLTVIADQTQPIEGRYRPSPPADSGSLVGALNLYVESPAVRTGAPSALSGRYNTPGPSFRADGIVGTLNGSDVTLAFLSNQLASDTVDVFVGQLAGGALSGQYRKHPGTTVTFVKQ